jgi:hypothetical protein
MEKRTYVRLPLYSLYGLGKDPSDKDRFVFTAFAAVETGLKLSSSMKNDVSEVLYAWYRKRETIQQPLVEMLESCENEILDDEDYCGFDANGKWDPFELDGFTEEVNSSPALRVGVRYFAAAKRGRHMLNLKESTRQILDAYFELNDTITRIQEEQGNPPLFQLHLDLVKNFAAKQIPPMAFLAYCAIRTIVGRKEYAKTNKKLINLRAQGLKRASESFSPDNEFYNRWTMDQAFIYLVKRGIIAKTNGWRTLYISTKLTQEDLIKKMISSMEKLNSKIAIGKKGAERIKELESAIKRSKKITASKKVLSDVD